MGRSRSDDCSGVISLKSLVKRDIHLVSKLYLSEFSYDEQRILQERIRNDPEDIDGYVEEFRREKWGVYATEYFLKMPQQRYLLMEWIANKVENNQRPDEPDIMEKVYELAGRKY